MEIQHGILILREDEINQRCPSNPSWAIAQLRAYTLEVIDKSEKLAPLLQCTEVLEKAGIPFRVEPTLPHSKPEMEPEPMELEAEMEPKPEAIQKEDTESGTGAEAAA